MPDILQWHWMGMPDKSGAGGERRDNTPLAPGLYLVATPIGNLEDITLRALRVLRSVDRIACEDTRQTQKLLNHFGIETPTVSYHMHNEAGRAAELIQALKGGARIAVVSDAGTPGISDPGEEIASAAIAAGIPVFPVPGANAVLTALIASGLPSEAFTFRGFLPAKDGQRRTVLEELRRTWSPEQGTVAFYEAPHRILEALQDVEMVFGAQQSIVLGRELTKMHEEFLRGAVVEVRAELERRPAVRGEIVLLFRPEPPAEQRAPASIGDQVRELMGAESLSEMDALKRIAKLRGIGKSAAYRELQRGRR
jgi:16S rRNA (cytidine1402-2'-O)-methyltransferase